jgi:cell pole-organizing protein PopZ
VNPAPEIAATAVEPSSRPRPPAAAAAPEPVAAAPVDAGLAATSPERLVAVLQTTPPPTHEERIPVSSEGYKKPELVSEEALAASTAALAQLAQSVTRTREPTPGQSRTVEEVVREAIEPMLKQWLDQHLPRIVERMVREAIDRVVRRVE